MFFNDEQYENSLKVFQTYQKEFGINFEAERYVSLSYYSMNNLAKAEKFFTKPMFFKTRGSVFGTMETGVLENMNKNVDAIHCYLKTLELEPDFNDAFSRLASIYQKEEASRINRGL